MQLAYMTQNGRVTITMEADSIKDLYRQLGQVEEVFEENKCGKCGKKDIRHVYRNIAGNEFFEVKCNDSKCRACLTFTTSKSDGGKSLFPKRKDKYPDGKLLDDQGWRVFEG